MKNILYIFICIFVVSCSSFLNTKQDICGQFVVINNKNTYNTAIDFIKIKEDLTKKLNLFSSNNTTNTCYLTLNIDNETYDSFSNEYGITTKGNIKTNIEIELKINHDIIFYDKIKCFHYINNFKDRYSNYNQTKINNIQKNITNNINLLVMEHINKIYGN